MRQLALAIALAAPVSAFAGGTAWRVDVLSVVESDAGNHVIRLRPREPLLLFAGCSTLTIRASYGWHWWQREKPMTKMEHREALKLLQEASASKREIAFGEMGAGLEKGQEQCVLISQGPELSRWRCVLVL